MWETLEIIEEQEQATAKKIQKEVGINRSTVNKHLLVLYEAGLCYRKKQKINEREQYIYMIR